MDKAWFSVNSLGFDLLQFDTAKPDPEIHYEVINDQNKGEHDFSLKLSDIPH